MKIPYNLNRFIEAQDNSYPYALNEIENGKKQTHWMWYIFPQLAGLGQSETSRYYAIENLNEARQYLEHPLLGIRLVEISNALLKIKDKTARQVFGSPDDLKLKSCMTLFNAVENAPEVFQAVLEKYFNGNKDLKTIDLIKGRV